jgi:hypothetical protein
LTLVGSGQSGYTGDYSGFRCLSRKYPDTKKRNRAFIVEFLKGKRCADCREKDPVVLEFDHRNPSEKIENVTRTASKGASLDNLIREIEKCDIVCANCHRRRTAKQLGFSSKTPISWGSHMIDRGQVLLGRLSCYCRQVGSSLRQTFL